MSFELNRIFNVAMLLGLILAAQPVSAQTISTISGNGSIPNGLNGNGGQASAASLGPMDSLVYDAIGNLYFTESYAIRKIATNGVLTTIAGTSTSGTNGNGGLATNARLEIIQALALDSAGNIYVATGAPENKIRKITLATGIITAFAGSGTCDGSPVTSGSNSSVGFCNPAGMAFDAANNLYVADRDGSQLFKLSSSGTTGNVNTFGAPGCEARDVKVAANGDILAICNSMISRYSANGTLIANLAGAENPYANYDIGDGGPATSAYLSLPRDLALDAAGNIFISVINSRVRRIDVATGIISTMLGTGLAGFSGDGGLASTAQISTAHGLAFSATGSLTLIDGSNYRIRRLVYSAPSAPTIVSAVGGFNQVTVSFNPPADTGGQSVTSYAATCGAATASASASPIVVPVALSGSVNCSVTASTLAGTSVASAVLSAQVQSYLIHTIAGTGTAGFGGDGGQAVSATLKQPTGVVVDASGNLIISDFSNHRIRKITPAGIISTIAGTGIAGSSGDGGQATSAQLNFPVSAIFDAAGNLYIAGFGEARIRKINTSGVISTVAGTGVAGFSGDGGPATSAQLYLPIGLAFDASGNLYFSERQNARVRKITIATGAITTVAGNGSTTFSGDGGLATGAGMNSHGAIAIDAANNLYIADGNHRIRRVTPAGMISTFAGTGIAGFSGDGGQAANAQLNGPYGIRFDATGNLYIGTTVDQRIRTVTPAGVISTVAGNGTTTLAANGGGVLSGAVRPDMDIAFDAAGNLYYASYLDNHVRKITRSVPAAPTIGSATANFSTGGVSVTFTPAPFNGGAPVTGFVATCGAATASGTSSPINVGGMPRGVNVSCSVQASNYVGNSAPSGQSNTVRPNVAPLTPTLDSVTPGNGQVSVAFTPNFSGGGTQDFYRAFCGSRSQTGTISPIIVTGLANGVAVTCTIRSENNAGIGFSQPSASVTPATVPNAPMIGLAIAGTGQISVAFTAPSNNGGAAISGYTASCGVINASGTSSPIVLTGFGNGVTVTCTVVAINSMGTSVPSAASNTVTTPLLPQSIAFGAAPSVIVDGTGTVSANGGASTNPVVFSSTTTATCTVIGAVVTGVTAGNCIIAANQAGNANYAAAAQVTQSFAIVVAQQSIAFGIAPTIGVGGSGTVTANGGASTNPVVFSSTTTAICTVDGVTVAGVSAGNCIIAANQAGNANYAAAAQVTQSFAIAVAQQTIAFGIAPTIAVGGSGTVSANGGASTNPVVFSSLTTATCTVSGAVVTGVTAENCIIAANQAGNANYAAAAQVTQSFVIAVAQQSISFGIAPTIAIGGSGTVSANGGASTNPVIFSSTTTAICTVNGVTVTGVSAGNCIIAANQAGNANYAAAAQVTQSFTITPRIFSVTPSTGANGDISPDQPQPVTQGATVVFVVTADPGYVANVSGSCGGVLLGTSYTTNAINADCSVMASFAAAATPPSAPTMVSVLPLNNAARINFNAPSDNGGSAILDYTASCTPGNFSVTQNALALDVTGLSNNAAYRCSVRARNAVGLSPVSAELSVIPGSSGTNADLSITKTNSRTFVNGAAPVEYLITVSNPGPAGVIGARVQDVIGAGTDFSAASWSCTALNNAACPGVLTGSGSLDAQIDLPAATSVRFVFIATPNVGLETPISNVASVMPPAAITDANLNNNVATDGPDIRGIIRNGFE